MPPSNGSPSIVPVKTIDDAVAARGLVALALAAIRPVLLGDPLERLVDLGVGDLGDQLLELDAP